MAGYKHPCRYCDEFIESNSKVCPLCGKVNPLGPLRCLKCRNPIQRGWKNCGNCGLALEAACPQCGKLSFLGDYCQHCDARMVVVCPHRKCKAEQPPLGDLCAQCGKPLK